MGRELRGWVRRRVGMTIHLHLWWHWVLAYAAIGFLCQLMCVGTMAVDSNWPWRRVTWAAVRFVVGVAISFPVIVFLGAWNLLDMIRLTLTEKS